MDHRQGKTLPLPRQAPAAPKGLGPNRPWSTSVPKGQALEVPGMPTDAGLGGSTTGSTSPSGFEGRRR